MKLIDEKGRLFGMINLIDLVVVIILVCSWPIFMYAYKTIAVRSVPPIEARVPVQMMRTTVRFSGLIKEASAAISEGDVEKDENDQVVGKIIKVVSKTNTEGPDLDSGQFVAAEDQDHYTVVAILDLSAAKRKGGFYYNEHLVKINSYISFSTDTYLVSGKVIRLDPQGLTK